MAAGFTYNLTPEEVKEERYDVETGRRRRGPYKLDTGNLPVGEYLPSFTPIAADLVKKTAKVAIRVEVAEKFTSGTTKDGQGGHTCGGSRKIHVRNNPEGEEEIVGLCWDAHR